MDHCVNIMLCVASTKYFGQGNADCRRVWAFTLIELLVAVAVIALLLAILLPGLGSAREAGRASLCVATLHNAGIAMTMYLDDNDGSFWPYFQDMPSPGGGRRWWFGFEPGGPSPNPWQGHRPLVRSEGYLSSYLTSSERDLSCPSFPYGHGKYFPKFSPSAGGYGYNTAALAGFNWIDPSTPRLRKIHEFDGRTADVFVFADGIHFDRLDYSGGVALEQNFNEPAYIQWQEPSFFSSNVGVNGGYGHFRHNSRANVLFLDAHVVSQPVRRQLHPYSGKGYGPVANLSDESMRFREITKGHLTLQVDLIYGLE